jgi:hypothetical protein
VKATWLISAQEAEKARYERMTNWHRVYAWWPTWVAEGDCRWLEWIERKCEYHGGYDGGTYRFDTFRPLSFNKGQTYE